MQVGYDSVTHAGILDLPPRSQLVRRHSLSQYILRTRQLCISLNVRMPDCYPDNDQRSYGLASAK